MGFFSRLFGKKKAEETPRTSEPRVVRNDPPISFFVAPNDALGGKLTGDANVYIAGSFNGVIAVSGLVWVAEGGRLKGRIYCEDAYVAGGVEGRIHASGVIDIAAGSECGAELEYGRLWSDGAFEEPAFPETEEAARTAETAADRS